MKLIDADALTNDLLFDIDLDEKALDNGDIVGAEREQIQFDKDCKQNCVYYLTETEPIDAVPVVRCKDCRWWDKSEDSPFGYCMAMKHGYMSANWEIGIYRRYKGDFYCADGERKEE